MASWLGKAEADALVVLADSAAEPELLPFVGDVHLGQCFVVARHDGRAQLGYFTEMERDEAARTGLALAGPREIDLEALRGLELSPGALLGDAVARVARLLEIEPGRLLVAGRTAAGDLLNLADRLVEGGWSLGSGSEIGRRIRKRKSLTELEEIRRVAAVVCEAFRRVAARLAATEAVGEGLCFEGAPVTAGSIRAEIGRVFAAAGLDQPHGNIVSMGADAGVPHTAGADERQLEAGESLIVDLYPRGWLYADCTRTFCVGDPHEELERAHALVTETLAAAHQEAIPGVTGWHLQQAACERLARSGYATPISDPGTTRGYVHNLGHGVGFALHEYPSFRSSAGEGGVLEPGDVFTLEPGLYDTASPNRYGVRLEDSVALLETGAENLTPIPYALDPRDW